jgi:hypothetical protein
LPLPTRVLFTSNLPASDTRLDSSPLGEPADVEGSGTAHTFTAAFPSGERVIVRFTPHAAAEPALDAVEGRSVTLVAISAFGNRITVFSAKKSRVMVNGRVKGDAGSKGLALERPTGADATLVIGDDRNRVQVTVPQTEAPLLQVHVGVASDLGSIVVTANEDGSEVSLNGHSKGVVRGGRLLLQALKPGTYTMGVAKPDFCVTPDRLTVNLPASGQADASFNVQRPVFRLGDAPPGAKVLLDGREVAAAGELGIVAGVHTLTARAPGYRDYDAQVQVACGAGTTVRLASVMKRESPERPPSLQRVPKRGALVLNLSPQQTTVAFYRRGDSGQEQLIDVALQLPVELEPGDYRLHLSAAKHAGRDITVSVRSGETSIITESLVPLERTWSPGLTAQKDGVQHASAVSLFGDDAASGDYSFRVFRQGLLTRRFFGTWIVAYRSPQDYVEFRVDDGQLQWRRGSSGDFQTIGRLTAEAQKMADERKSVLVRLHVTGGNVSHEVGGDASTLSPVGSPVQLHEGQIGLAKGSQIADFSH